MFVVSIDGDAFAGRTTISRELSIALNAKYLDIKILSQLPCKKVSMELNCLNNLKNPIL